MKKLILILCLLISIGIKAQTTETDSDIVVDTENFHHGIDTTQFVKYQVCMTCGEQWKNGNKQPGQIKSQDRILQENTAAKQVSSNGKRIFNGVIGTLIGAAVASVTYVFITKSTTSINELIK